MLPISFGSEGPKPTLPWWFSWKFFWSSVAIAAACLSFAFRSYGGCTTIPSSSELLRRDAICSSLHLPHLCFFSPTKLVGGAIYSFEGFFALNINNKNIGVFPMPGAIPADPSMCSDKVYLQELLRYHTGSPQIQQRIKRMFPTEVAADDVVFFDNVLGSESDPGLCTIAAQLMVVHK